MHGKVHPMSDGVGAGEGIGHFLVQWLCSLAYILNSAMEHASILLFLPLIACNSSLNTE
jgi:hypothetical protein